MTWMRPGRTFLIEEEVTDGQIFTPVTIEYLDEKGLKATVRFPSGGTMRVPTRLLVDPEEQ